MLQPITPQEALQHYLESRENELAKTSIQEYEYRLSHFIGWCQQENLNNLNDLTGRDLMAYKNWRRKDGNLNKTSLRTQLDCLRVFIKWCQKINAVEANLAEKIDAPTIGKEGTRDV